jgi:hypothetical protein
MTLKTFTGELVRLNSREVQGRNGPVTAYSGKICKPDGEEYEEWVGFGFKKPACRQGDSVVISAKKENGFWKTVDVEVTEKAGEPDSASGDNGSSRPAKESVQAASPSKNGSRQTQQNIHYQNSRSAALELTGLLLLNKAVPLSATVGKSGEAKRFAEITALVDKLTVSYFHDLETFRLINDIEDVYEVVATDEQAEVAATAEQSDDDDE